MTRCPDCGRHYLSSIEFGIHKKRPQVWSLADVFSWWIVNNFVQKNPFEKCHCRRRCHGHKCSHESRRRWGKRESKILRFRLRRAKKQQALIFYGNLNFGTAVEAADVTKTLARFGKTLKPQQLVWRYYLEPNEDGKRVHAHIVVISQTVLTHGMIRRYWTEALGSLYRVRQTSVSFSPVKSISAVGKYVTGQTCAKKKIGLFSKQCKVRITGGSTGFFEKRNSTELYQSLCRQDHAYRIASQDGDIIDHPDINYYLTLADEQFAAEKRAEANYKLGCSDLDQAALDRLFEPNVQRPCTGTNITRKSHIQTELIEPDILQQKCKNIDEMSEKIGRDRQDTS